MIPSAVVFIAGVLSTMCPQSLWLNKYNECVFTAPEKAAKAHKLRVSLQN